MNLEEFQKGSIKKDLRIDDSYGRIFSFIDFGNVTYWFSNDDKDGEGNILKDNFSLYIRIQKLYNFCNIFSKSSKFYYGFDPGNTGSTGFIIIAKRIFGGHNVFTKEIQQIKHYLNDDELIKHKEYIRSDLKGDFIYIPKCNFDVEISVDAIRLVDNYDTICLFSGDSDFVRLLSFLKEKGKKVILIKSGLIKRELALSADLLISAQDIKKYITDIVETQKSSRS